MKHQTISHKTFKRWNIEPCRFICSVTHYTLKRWEIFLWVLKLIHILPNLIVMCPSWMTGKVCSNFCIIMHYIDSKVEWKISFHGNQGHCQIPDLELDKGEFYPPLQGSLEGDILLPFFLHSWYVHHIHWSMPLLHWSKPGSTDIKILWKCVFGSKLQLPSFLTYCSHIISWYLIGIWGHHVVVCQKEGHLLKVQ